MTLEQLRERVRVLDDLFSEAVRGEATLAVWEALEVALDDAEERLAEALPLGAC